LLCNLAYSIEEIDEELALGMASLNLIRTTNTNDNTAEGEVSDQEEDGNAKEEEEKEEIHDIGLKPKKVVHHQKQPQQVSSCCDFFMLSFD
jgi:hypothetical protein